ncbi:MAG: RNA polymerase sporulation sigma factor SigK [Clostridiales bacterium]|jgi:RNA polymerase sporulation-specific sigma factor|nr:RNA polymerase sporulation sigma factor SigK [Clostridiales bacterium]
MLNFIFILFNQIIFLLGFVVNNSAFLKPLSPEEEEQAINAMLQGDLEARNKLIEHNLRLVAHVAKKYISSGIDNDDLISIGTIGLIKGINSFDPTKSIKLATYAARCIDNEILMVIRADKKHMGEVSLDEPIGYDSEGKDVTLIDVVSDGSRDISEEIHLKLEMKKVYKLMETELDDRERQIIAMRYGLDGYDEMPQREIAKELNISRSYVSRIERKALLKLSGEMINTSELPSDKHPREFRR